MFKNIGDMLSGKRAKENRADVFTSTEPSERFKASDMTSNPTDRNFATALAWNTSTIVGNMLFESKITCLASLTKSCEPESLRRLAAFVAWWSVQHYQEGARSVAAEEPDSEAAVAEWIVATTRVLELMYPPDDVGGKAIAVYQEGERRVGQPGFLFSTLEAVRNCVGLEAVDLGRDFMSDHLAVSSVLIAHKNSLVEVFGVLQGNG